MTNEDKCQNSNENVNSVQKCRYTDQLMQGAQTIYIGMITVNFLNIWTPKTFVVITLKFELSGSTIE